MPTLVAKTRIKFGSKGRPGPFGQVLSYEAGTTVAPGETFTAEGDLAKQLLADGSAMTQADARAETRDAMSAEAKLREAEQEARDAGLNVSVTIGATGPGPDAAAAHRAQQEAEEAAVKDATKDEKKPAARGGSR